MRARPISRGELTGGVEGAQSARDHGAQASTQFRGLLSPVRVLEAPLRLGPSFLGPLKATLTGSGETQDPAASILGIGFDYNQAIAFQWLDIATQRGAAKALIDIGP